MKAKGLDSCSMCSKIYFRKTQMISTRVMSSSKVVCFTMKSRRGDSSDLSRYEAVRSALVDMLQDCNIYDTPKYVDKA